MVNKKNSELILLNKLRQKLPDINHQTAMSMVDLLIKSLKENVHSDKKLTIKNFGTFFEKTMKERQAKVPSRNDSVTVKEKKKLCFRPSKNIGL